MGRVFFFAKFLHIIVKIRSAYRQTGGQRGTSKETHTRLKAVKDIYIYIYIYIYIERERESDQKVSAHLTIAHVSP